MLVLDLHSEPRLVVRSADQSDTEFPQDLAVVVLASELERQTGDRWAQL